MRVGGAAVEAWVRPTALLSITRYIDGTGADYTYALGLDGDQLQFQVRNAAGTACTERVADG